MQLDQLKQKIKEVSEEFPRLPAAITHLLGVLDQEESGPEEIVSAIAADPGLTTKILRVANSAYYGFPSAISELNRAVPLIGLDMVRSLALSVAALQGLAPSRPQTSLDREDLWLHSLATGALMSEMARRMGYRASHLFILGFLHDIGKLVLDKFFADDFQECLNMAQSQGCPLCQAEQSLLGQDHGFFGAALLAKWLFPSTIIRPVQIHHQDRAAEQTMDVVLLRVADVLVNRALSSQPQNLELSESELAFLKITPQQVAELVAFVKQSRQGLTDMLAAMG